MATIDWSVRAIRDATDVEHAQRLFREYSASVGVCECFEGFEEEVNGLPGAYSPPRGTLLLGFLRGDVVGCAGVRPLDKPLPAGRFRLRACELKRLYVCDSARGEGIGRGLLRRALRDAHSMKYQAMVLDTLPDRMQEAVRLYEEFGFVRCEPFHDYGNSEVRFMFRRLT